MQTPIGNIRRLSTLIISCLAVVSLLNAQENPVPVLKSIVLNNDSVLYHYYDADGLALGDTSISIGHEFNNILFEVEDYHKTDTISIPEKQYYSFRLDGYDQDWSLWNSYPVKEYTNLHSGIYRLMVRCGPAGEIMNETVIASFRIKRPFYFTNMMLALYLIVFTLIVIILYRNFIHRHIRKQAVLEKIIAERTEELMAEKEKTEALLANLLPKGTADELMEKGKATKKKFTFVTVLFSDIQGFTRIAEEVNPEVLIDELDKFFFQFDNVVEKYNIEKIKTIGDAYMCAGGIPKINRTNPVEVVLAAIEMQRYMEDMKEEQRRKGLIFWDIRIGIHTGTVVAGVVGHKKLSYDIWGDTVNTASRMESSGEAGKINISGTTYDYIRDFFICEYRGKMPVKYKGELDMYFVNGIRPELRIEGKNEPNSKFQNKLLLLRISDIEDEVSDIYISKETDIQKFHNSRYLKNIFTQSELIGRAEGLNDEDMIDLLLASVFIITGYLENHSDPYPESIAMLKHIAPGYGFTEEQIGEASAIISDAVTSSPATLCGMILNDSINDHFGRVDLLEKLDQQFEEELSSNPGLNRKEWYTDAIKKISAHQFFTPTSRMLRTRTLEDQIAVLEEYISKI